MLHAEHRTLNTDTSKSHISRLSGANRPGPPFTCRDTVEMKRRHAITVSVQLSSRMSSSRDKADLVNGILAESLHPRQY